MKRFHSYGPVDCKKHFCVKRRDIIANCKEQLIGDPNEGGYYFTIWAPRQTGKTWLMRQVKKDIEEQYKETFAVHCMSLGRLRGADAETSPSGGLPRIFSDLLEISLPTRPQVRTWKDFNLLFFREGGLWDRPLIFFIDEVDTAPPMFLDALVAQFREMYLDREANWLHGLALIGVRAVLGVESDRGSPFNIQRSLHVPRFTPDEVNDLFLQYVQQSGQEVSSKLVEKVYEITRGQPGLVCWFGELLTEKYNPRSDKTINMAVWKKVYHLACHVERNNTILNLIKKARSPYLSNVLDLFTRADVAFQVDADWCDYLYLNGIIDSETEVDAMGRWETACRFSCPFIHHRLYNALTYDLVGDRPSIASLEPLDDLADVFGSDAFDLPALLQRYKNFLARLKAKGLDPWKEQPRRADPHLTEAVGHFHLYAWLQNAVGRRCVISPEFPTGNGKVDLHLACGEKRGIIEVKSFVDAFQVNEAKSQAARYAAEVDLNMVTVALFVPVEDEEVLSRLSGEEVVDGVTVAVVAIAWA